MEAQTPLIEELQKGNVTEEMMEDLQPMYDQMAEDISKQNKRLGGKMAVAQAIFSRKQRDSMRKILGSKCVFIVLNMSRECQKKRVIARHGESNEELLNMLIKFAEMYEPAGEDEENAYNVEITEDMNRDDVIEKILKIVNNVEEKEVAYPWKNGYWYNKGVSTMYYNVDGDEAELCSLLKFDYPETKPTFSQPWKYGDFGPAPQEIIDLTGIKNYNIEITTIMGTPAPAVLNNEGNKIYMFGFTKQVDTIECLSDEDMKKILEDREPADAPSCPYFEPNPDAPRKIIWLSGMEYVW